MVMLPEALLPSEIARMVYGYLLDERCTEAARFFLKESSKLEECRQVLSMGRRISTRFCQLTLLDVLEECCLVNAIVQEELNNFGKLDKLKYSSDLTNQIKILFEEYKSQHFTPTNNATAQSTPSLHESPSKVRKRRIFSNKEDGKSKRIAQEFTSETDDHNILDQSPLRSIEATPLKNLPGYVDEFENEKHKKLNSKTPEQNSITNTPQKDRASHNAYLQCRVQKGDQNIQVQEKQKNGCHDFNKNFNFQKENLKQYMNCEVQTEMCSAILLHKNVMTNTEQKTCIDSEVQTSDIGSPQSEVEVAEILGNFTEKHTNPNKVVEKIVKNINEKALEPPKSNLVEKSKDDGKEACTRSFLAEFNKAVETAANKSENDPEIVDLLNEIVLPPAQNLTKNKINLNVQCGINSSSSQEQINSVSEEMVSESSIEKDVISSNVNNHKILENENNDKSKNTVNLRNSSNLKLNCSNHTVDQVDTASTNTFTSSTNSRKILCNTQITENKNNIKDNTETSFNTLDSLHLQKNSTNKSDNGFNHNNTITSTPIKTFTAMENFDSCDWFSTQEIPTTNIAFYKEDIPKSTATTTHGIYTYTEGIVTSTQFLSPITAKDTNKMVQKVNCTLANTVKDQSLHTPDIFFPPKINTAVIMNSDSYPMNSMQKTKTPKLQKTPEMLDQLLEINSLQKLDKNFDNLSSELKDNNSNDCNKYFNVDSIMLFGVDNTLSSIPMPMHVQEIEMEDSITLTGIGLSPFLKVIKQCDNNVNNTKKVEKTEDTATSNEKVLSTATGNKRTENNILESKISEHVKHTPTKVTSTRPKTTKKSLSTPKKPNSYIRALNFDTPINRSQSESKVNNTDACLSPNSLTRSLKDACKSSLFQSPPITNCEIVEQNKNTIILPTIPELTTPESKSLKNDSNLPKKESIVKSVVTEKKSWDSDLRKYLGKSEDESKIKTPLKSSSSRKSSKKAKKDDKNTPKKEMKSYKKSSKKSKKDEKDEKLSHDKKKEENIKVDKTEAIKTDNKKEEIKSDKKKVDIKADKKKEDIKFNQKKEDISTDKKKEDIKTDNKKKIVIIKKTITDLNKESAKKDETNEIKEKNRDSKSNLSNKRKVEDVKVKEGQLEIELKKCKNENIQHVKEVNNEMIIESQVDRTSNYNKKEQENLKESNTESKLKNIDINDFEHFYSLNNAETIEPVEPKVNNESTEGENVKQKPDPLVALLSDGINDDNNEIQNIAKLPTEEIVNLSKLNDEMINGMPKENSDVQNIQEDDISNMMQNLSDELTAQVISKNDPETIKSSVDYFKVEEQVKQITNPEAERTVVIYDEVRKVECGKIVQKKYARLKTLDEKLELNTSKPFDKVKLYDSPGKNENSLQVPPTPQVLSPGSSSLMLPLSTMNEDSRTIPSLIATPLECPKTPNIVFTPPKNQTEWTSDVPQKSETYFTSSILNPKSSKKPEITQFEVIKENLIKNNKQATEACTKNEEDNLPKIQAPMSYREKQDDLTSENNDNTTSSSSSCSCESCCSSSTSESDENEKEEKIKDTDDSSDDNETVEEEEEEDEDEEEMEEENEIEVKDEKEINKQVQEVLMPGEKSPTKVFSINKSDKELAETVHETPAKDSSCVEVDIFDTPNVSKPVDQPMNLNEKISQMMILKDQENKIVQIKSRPKIINVKRVLPKVITKPPTQLIKAQPKNNTLEVNNDLMTIPPTSQTLKIEKSEEEVVLAIKSIENDKFNKSQDELSLLTTPSPANKSVDKNISNKSELAHAIASITQTETDTIKKFGVDGKAFRADGNCSSDVLEDNCGKDEENSNGTKQNENAQSARCQSALNDSHSHNTRFQSRQKEEKNIKRLLGNCTQPCHEIRYVFDETTYKRKRRKAFSETDLTVTTGQDSEEVHILLPTSLDALLEIKPPRKKPVRRAQVKKEKCSTINEESNDSIMLQKINNDSESIPDGVVNAANSVNDETSSKRKRPLEEGVPPNKQIVKKHRKNVNMHEL